MQDQGNRSRVPNLASHHGPMIDQLCNGNGIDIRLKKEEVRGRLPASSIGGGVKRLSWHTLSSSWLLEGVEVQCWHPFASMVWSKACPTQVINTMRRAGQLLILRFVSTSQRNYSPGSRSFFVCLPFADGQSSSRLKCPWR